MNELAKLIPEKVNFKEAITAGENFLKTLPQLELKVFHHFAPGVYARELHIPSGVVLTGAIHKTEHLFILSAGEIEQISEHAGLERIKAPFTCISKPGAKRLGVSLTDVVVTTIHATNETSIEKLESDLVCNSYEEFEQYLISTTKQLKEGL